MKLEFRLISSDQDEYREIMALRYEGLRKPIGLTFTEAEVFFDTNHIHVAAYNEQNEICGTCMLVNKEDQALKIQRVVVDEKHQRQGIGREMMDFCIDYARQHQYKIVYVHARETAFDFYEKIGFQSVGDIFIEATIPHKKMMLDIAGQ